MFADTFDRTGIRILVVANETARGDELRHAVLAQAEHRYPAQILVVAPALNSRIRHWLSDDDDARQAAMERVRDCVGRLDELGFEAEGTIGDPDPLQAIADALAAFPADRLIIATHPPGRSNWLERDLVARALAQFRLPVAHVVVESDAPPARRVQPLAA